MKRLFLIFAIAFAALAMGDITVAFAKPVTIFDCHLPDGKLVTVTQDA
jgi:hypothetical protein